MQFLFNDFNMKAANELNVAAHQNLHPRFEKGRWFKFSKVGRPTSIDPHLGNRWHFFPTHSYQLVSLIWTWCCGSVTSFFYPRWTSYSWFSKWYFNSLNAILWNISKRQNNPSLSCPSSRKCMCPDWGVRVRWGIYSVTDFGYNDSPQVLSDWYAKWMCVPLQSEESLQSLILNGWTRCSKCTLKSWLTEWQREACK